MKQYKHYVQNSKDPNKKGPRTYIAKCGTESANFAEMVAQKSLHKVTCPECLLQLMTDYENKIAILEDRYNELYPNRPVGQKVQ